MFFARAVGLNEREHLHLVELVDAEDPPCVLAVGAGLHAEACRGSGVAEGQLVSREDLIAVHGREWHLGGADEVEVIFLDGVDLFSVRREEAGAEQRLLPNEDRRNHRRESLIR